VGGAHAIHVSGGRPRIETVAAGRGDRPWALASQLASATSQVEDFATPGWQHGVAKPSAGRKSVAPNARPKPPSTKHKKAKSAPKAQPQPTTDPPDLLSANPDPAAGRAKAVAGLAQ